MLFMYIGNIIVYWFVMFDVLKSDSCNDKKPKFYLKIGRLGIRLSSRH